MHKKALNAHYITVMVKVCASLLRAAQYVGDDRETPGIDWEVLKGTGNDGVGTICKSGLDNSCQTFFRIFACFVFGTAGL
jgi:hypothetical protein